MIALDLLTLGAQIAGGLVLLGLGAGLVVLLFAAWVWQTYGRGER